MTNDWSCYPPFLVLADETAYEAYFRSTYCVEPIVDYIGWPVRFRVSQFSHCCYESTQRNSVKDMFSSARAQRLGWITDTLQSDSAVQYQGWDKRRKCYDPSVRVSNLFGDFVVVVKVLQAADTHSHHCVFRTCFVADNSMRKIRSSPIWTP